MRVLLVGTMVSLAGCNRSPAPMRTAEEPAALRARPVAGLDSATIEKLCVAPDSVRAGKAECVLKDQSAPAPQRAPAPPSTQPRYP